MKDAERTHFFLRRKATPRGICVMTVGNVAAGQEIHVVNILLRMLCRLYEQEKGGDSDGTLGAVA